MGLRFRKSIKIAPGIKLNLGKKSSSITFGGKGARYTINSKGKRTASVGIPGTGLSYSASTTKKKKDRKSKPKTNKAIARSPDSINNGNNNVNKKKPGCGCGCLSVFIIGLVFCITIGIGTSTENSKSKNIDNPNTGQQIEASMQKDNQTTEDNSSPDSQSALTNEQPTQASNPPVEIPKQPIETYNMYTKTALKVRAGPGTNYNSLTTLPSGSEIDVVKEEKDWTQIIYHGAVAYVATKYISHVEQDIDDYEPSNDNSASAEMVWIPATGSKYHRTSTCSNMKNPSQVTKEKAVSIGFTPCKKCYG